VGLAMDQMRVNAKVDAITNGRSETSPSPTYFVHLIKRYQRKVETRVARMLTIITVHQRRHLHLLKRAIKTSNEFSR